MRITTWNVNGLRAALGSGLADVVATTAPDILMLQEVRALPEQLDPRWRDPAGWHVAWHPAERKGYSGVATWSRTPLEVLGRGIDGEDDPDGRVLVVRTAGLRLVNVYLPSGSSGDQRQAAKEAFMARLLPWAATLAAEDEPTLIAGDLNVAHTADDIHAPGPNKDHSGFMPHEREWFGDLLAAGWSDITRAHFGARKGPYTWWSTRGQARALDRGWRIDYLLANAALAGRCGPVLIDRRAGVTVSDHAPLTVELDGADALRTGVEGAGELAVELKSPAARARAAKKKPAKKKPAKRKAKRG